jgi:chromosome segregation ATPase
MLKDKDGNTTRLKDATKNMQDLSQRLVESERIKSELLRMNAELKTMLTNIESKGTQIAKLAKEKVLKYKDENDLMQQELSDLKVGAAAANVEGAKQAAEALPVNEELWCKINELQGQVSNALRSVDSTKLDGLERSLNNASEANEALKASVEEARVKTGEGLSALSVENDQLRALVEEFDVTRKELKKKDALNRDALVEQQNCVSVKDREIVELKEELNRLKGAIGQLIGSK